MIKPMKSYTSPLHVISLILMLIAGPLFHLTASAEEAQTKMCWAHFVGWGFDQVNGYDKAALDPFWMKKKFNDRSLLGRHVQTDEGACEGTKKQVRTALNYGIDGFCVDLIIRESHKPDFYANTMKRFFRAAEGTPFKIALCIDQSNPTVDGMTAALEDFLKTWGKHPNSCLVDGKPVIFMYNSKPRTLDEWKTIITTLKERRIEAYWLVQPQREWTLWGNSKILADNLAVFDGLYDFGINGFTPEQMLRRLTNGIEAIKNSRPGNILCAGITQGYLGNANSFYRPYLNTGTLRQNWEAAIKSGAQWVCITTWNDYIEHTHFEPSVVNRDSLLRINRDLVARWRDTPLPPRPPQVFVSYHEEVSLGDDWTLEVLCLPYTIDPSKVEIRLLSLKGETFFQPPPIDLKREKIEATTLRLPQPGIAGPRKFRVQCRVISSDADNSQWKELYPVVVRYGHIESLRTIHIPMDSLAATPKLKLKREKGKRKAIIRFDRWTLAGKIELLRNGWPVAEKEIAHKGAPHVTIELPIPAADATPDDTFIARYSNLSGDVSWSALAAFSFPDAKADLTPQPVVVTGSDFDEGWWSDGFSRLDHPEIVTQQFTKAEIFAVTYRMDEQQEGDLISTSVWRVPAIPGAQHRWMKHNGQHAPSWKKAKNKQPALHFNGDDCLILPSRMMPYGPFTFEINIKPEKSDKIMYLYSDFCGVSIQISEDSYILFKRDKKRLTSNHKIKPGVWTHIAVIYTGNRFQLYINGLLDKDEPAEIKVKRINSLPAIGSNSDYSNGFQGEMGGFHMQAGVLQPASFVLKERK